MAKVIQIEENNKITEIKIIHKRIDKSDFMNETPSLNFSASYEIKICSNKKILDLVFLEIFPKMK